MQKTPRASPGWASPAEKKRRGRIMAAKRLAFVGASAILVILCITLLSHPNEKNSETGSPSAGVAVGRTAVPANAGVVSAPASGPTSLSTEQPWHQSNDPLLVLVNDRVPLPDDWTVDLVPISEDSDVMVDRRIYADLTAMTEAARQEDIWFWVSSGYRSKEEQQDILDQAVSERISQGLTEEEALEDALRTIQRPGYSEHHTGLVVDFNYVNDEFETTAAYAWLCRHAAEYGFVQRYRADKADITNIDNESWHYRYVGRKAAMAMAERDQCLEEYLGFSE